MPEHAQHKAISLGDGKILRTAILDSFRKLNPRTMVKNPVMFVVEVGALVTTIQLVRDYLNHAGSFGWGLQITLWLWFTVVFANFAEAMAEGRGKAQAEALRKSRRDVTAKKLSSPQYGASHTSVSATQLRKGDAVLEEAGDFIPSDGTVVEGVASV